MPGDRDSAGNGDDIRMDYLDETDWLRVMTVLCVRNTRLEDIYAGKAPVTKTGDFSDVIVVDADGRRIPWPEVSHFGDKTMKELMRDIVNRLYTLSCEGGRAGIRLHLRALVAGGEALGFSDAGQRVPHDERIQRLPRQGRQRIRRDEVRQTMSRYHWRDTLEECRAGPRSFGRRGGTLSRFRPADRLDPLAHGAG